MRFCDGGRACRVARSAVLAIAGAVAGCSGMNLPSWNFDLLPKTGTGAAARLLPKNSSVTGTVSFIQRGNKVNVAAVIQELSPGRHRMFIHEVGNCSSLNAASAGKVWAAAGQTPGKRLGDLPDLFAGTEGNANVTASLSGITVGDGGPADVIGRSVVVHDGMEADPRPEFGVANDWLACGVIERK